MQRKQSNVTNRSYSTDTIAVVNIGSAPFGARYANWVPIVAPQHGTGNARSVSYGTQGPCFQCGKLGHFRKQCPLLLNSTAKQ